MAIIDPTRTWKLMEERLETLSSARHKRNLQAVIDHAKAEASGSLEDLLATLTPEPKYHFWEQGTDVGPKGREAVSQFYIGYLASRANVLEFDLKRVVVDDSCVVTEGRYRAIYPGASAIASGLPADDPSGTYLLEAHMVIMWPCDDDGLIIGEDSIASSKPELTKLEVADLPTEYLDLVGSASG